MKKENLWLAKQTVEKINHLEDILRALNRFDIDPLRNEYNFIIKFREGLEYTVPENVLSMFKHLTETSIQTDLDELNKKLEDL